MWRSMYILGSHKEFEGMQLEGLWVHQWGTVGYFGELSFLKEL